MKRDITERLVAWAQSPYKKPLLLTGVRQCGKTYALKDLGETEFDGNCAYFNFEHNPKLKALFACDLDPKRILEDLSVFHGSPIVPGKTLLILDEIQGCIPALTSLKYFAEELPELHVACAGSLLGVALKDKDKQISFPVGKVDRLQMYPMNFREFLGAVNPGLLRFFEHKYTLGAPVDEMFVESLEKALKIYYVVGGMPDVVHRWVKTRDLSLVEDLQDNILKDYQNDFSKHAPPAEVPRLNLVWDSLPVQLAKENNKFVFGHVQKGKTARDLEDALGWLEDAGLAYRLKLIESPIMPLKHKASDRDFKLYMVDVGLLRRRAGISARTIMEDGDGYREFKGAFTENFAMQELLSMGKQPYFWRSSNQAEVDFIFQEGDSVVPVEVKADVHTKAKSFGVFCGRYHPNYGFKVSLRNVGDHIVGDTQVYSVPLYLMWKLNDFIELERAKEPHFDFAEIAASVEAAFEDELEDVDGLIEQAGMSAGGCPGAMSEVDKEI